MLYRAIGRKLTAERQRRNAPGLLDRLVEELGEAFGNRAFTLTNRGTTKKRPKREFIELTFTSAKLAREAEEWIDSDFDAD